MEQMTDPGTRNSNRFRSGTAAALTLALLVFLMANASQAQSARDGFDPNANGQIRCFLVQSDGKILIGGYFSTVAPNGGPTISRRGIARLNSNGTVDAAFDLHSNGDVLSIVSQADGKILVAGTFNNIGGQPRVGIARLDPLTGQADSFDPNSDGGLDMIVIESGKMYVTGGFNHIGGQERSYIARLDPVTGLADSWNPRPNGAVTGITVQPDGKVIVGGWFQGPEAIAGQTRYFLARLDGTTGEPDSFNAGGPNDGGPNNVVTSLTRQADGKVIATGPFTYFLGQYRSGIARFDPWTGYADSFNPTVPIVNSAVVQPDGKIIAFGNYWSYYIARFDPVTGEEDSFDEALADLQVAAVAVQPDGKVLIGGNFSSVGGQTRNYAARVDSAGQLDQTLELQTDAVSIYATALQADGKILIGGSFGNIFGVARHNIARLNTDNTLDPSFDPNASGIVRTIVVQDDGKILAGGSFNGSNSIGGQTRNYIARLDPVTGQADSFNPNANGVVHSIALQGDGSILVGGEFNGANSIGGQARNRIARLDPSTGLADSFDPNANAAVRTLVVQADGKILVGGEFNSSNSIGGQARNFFARLDLAGVADSFDPNANGIVHSIALQPDGKILIGGAFGGANSIGGAVRNHIARLDPNNGLADSFDPNATDNVYAIAVQSDGRILAGGAFHGAGSLGGQPRNHVARLNPSTGLPDVFDPNTNNDVQSIVLQSDGKILLGGTFNGGNSVGLETRNGFARLGNDTAALLNLTVTPTGTVTWTRGGSSPPLARVTFEYSTDDASYSLLGNGIASGNSWTLTGITLPIQQNFFIRARGSRFVSGPYTEESVRNGFVAARSSCGNISTRVRVEPADRAMIGGFIITGTQAKTVIVRGIGPTLPVPGALADPVIEVYGPEGQLLSTNDNWRDADTAQQIMESGLAPANDFESALWGIIDPGAYTVVVRGKDNTSGVGLFEVYDLDQTVDSRLGNISTRGFVQAEDNVLIGGVIVLGQAPLNVLVRGIGPSLPLNGKLADPTLELHDAMGTVIGANDNWRSDQESEINATGIPPSNDSESAILQALSPGNYTVILRGANNTTGVAVVEAYGLN